MALRYFLLVVGLPISVCLAAPGNNLTLPLTAGSLSQYLAEKPETNVESFLAALPPSYRDHFVLMHHTRSLHQSSYEQPRQIFFGPDARFLMGVSGVPTDPRYSVIEFAEFSESDGQYHFGTVNFGTGSKPKVTENIKSCAGCHGSPTRPIWGQYPNWGGAYGDAAGKISGEDTAGFVSFLETRLENPRYAFLQFTAPKDGSYFGLTSRRYPFANTDFNHEMGNTVALGTLTRIKGSQNFDEGQFALLAASDALECIRTDAWFDISKKISRRYDALFPTGFPKTSNSFIKAMRVLGVDPEFELSLESPVFELAKPGTYRTNGKWQTGAFRLDEAIAFHLMNDLLLRDPQFEKLVKADRKLIDHIATLATLTGEARAAALKKSYAWFLFFDVFDPLVADKPGHAALCEYLAHHIDW